MNVQINPFLCGRPLYESLGKFVEERFEEASRFDGWLLQALGTSHRKP